MAYVVTMDDLAEMRKGIVMLKRRVAEWSELINTIKNCDEYIPPNTFKDIDVEYYVGTARQSKTEEHLCKALKLAGGIKLNAADLVEGIQAVLDVSRGPAKTGPLTTTRVEHTNPRDGKGSKNINADWNERRWLESRHEYESLKGVDGKLAELKRMGCDDA